jgi:photosystem II stability/assembly factor-like uncharacterized protein
VKSRFLLLVGAILFAILRHVSAADPSDKAYRHYGPWVSSEIGGGGYFVNLVFTGAKSIVYTYSDVSGPFRSSDGGKTWRMIFGSMPSFNGQSGVRSLLVSPVSPDHLIIARGTQWSAKDGVYASSDGGKTWRRTLEAQAYANEPYRYAGTLLAAVPHKPQEALFASAGEGVFMTHDFGSTWSRLDTGPAGRLPSLYPTDLKIDLANPNQIWLCAIPITLGAQGVSYEGGFYRSDDGGVHWQKLAEKSPTELTQSPGDPTQLLGLFDAEGPRVSRDGGETWTDAFEGLPINFSADGSVSESRFDALGAGPDFFLIGSRRGTFYRRGIQDSSWTGIERQGVQETYEGREWFGSLKLVPPGGWQRFGASASSIVVDPRDPAHWFFGDWYGLYQTGDAGHHWRLSMDGVELTGIFVLSQDPSNGRRIHLGMGDNGYFRSDDGGKTFKSVPFATNIKCISFSPSDPNCLYAVGTAPSSGVSESNYVYTSTNGGDHWTASAMAGLPPVGTFHCNSIATDPFDAKKAYLAVSGSVQPGGGGVYRTLDGGNHWTWFGSGLPSSLFFHDTIWTVSRELTVSSDGTVLALSVDQKELYRLPPGASQWTACAVNLNDLPYMIASDWKTPGRFFVAAGNQGLLRSLDGGVSWSTIFSGHCLQLAVDQAQPNRIAASTDDGIELSEDGGAHWKALPAELPERCQDCLGFAGDHILAATPGSGVFWMSLPFPLARR